MFMLNLFKNITGYVHFYGNGVFPERFLNLCAKNNILVWEAKANVNDLSGKMYAKDYKKIKTLAKKSCMRLKVTKRCGLPFLIRRYRFRYGIPVGVVLFFFLLFYLSGLCLNISLVCDKEINKEKVLNSLSKTGIYLGRKISEIDTEKTRQIFLIENPEFSWAAFNIKGCFVDVELIKTEKKQATKNTKKPCNIVAKTDGKILKIKAYSGRVSVKIGEAVAKGDLLVSGAIELTNKATKFVHSNAEVIAQTRHKLTVFVPFNYKQKVFDETTKKRSVFNIANIKIPLFFGEVKRPYISKHKIKNYSFLGVELPFSKTTAFFKTYRYEKMVLNQETAKVLAIKKMNEKSKQTLKDTIKSVEYENFDVKNSGILFTKVFICEENIASTKNILK